MKADGQEEGNDSESVESESAFQKLSSHREFIASQFEKDSFIKLVPQKASLSQRDAMGNFRTSKFESQLD